MSSLVPSPVLNMNYIEIKIQSHKGDEIVLRHMQCTVPAMMAAERRTSRGGSRRPFVHVSALVH